MNLFNEQFIFVSAVSEFILHPDWKHDDMRYDADIAIAVMVRSVTFTKFVKPICLWTSTSSYSDIVGSKGVIAGWGKTESSAEPSPRPKWTEVKLSF